MKKLNMKGFGVLEGLLILIIVGIVAGTSYYVYNANKNLSSGNDGTEIVKSEAGNAEEPAADLTANWKTYTNEKAGFSFKYPEDWTISEDKEAGVISLKTSDYKRAKTTLEEDGYCPKIASGYEMSVTYTTDYTDGDYTYKADKNLVSKIISEAQDSPFYKDAELTNIDGKEAVRYLGTPGECGWAETTATYANGYEYYIKGSMYKDLGEYKDEYNLLIKSFKLN